MESYLNYGLLIWEKESHRIDTLQKKAIRQVTNSIYNAHTIFLFKREGVLKVQDMFKLRLVKFYYKLSYGLLPQYLNCYRDVIEKQPPCVLRQYIIHQPMIKRVYAECSPLFQLIKLLNNMRTDPTDVILEKIITKSESYGRLS